MSGIANTTWYQPPCSSNARSYILELLIVIVKLVGDAVFL